jgi:hypothetical protein
MQKMKKVVCIAIMALFCAPMVINAAGPAVETMRKGAADSTAVAAGTTAYRIDKPGTITFTVGVKIKGKVEKPQVMIFLPKEKPFYQKTTFSYSFSDDIMEPLPFTPIEK